jgi:hypothetical protein
LAVQNQGTKQEEEAGKIIILDLLNNQPFNSAVAFTDGSCSGNFHLLTGSNFHFSILKQEYQELIDCPKRW